MNYKTTKLLDDAKECFYDHSPYTSLDGNTVVNVGVKRVKYIYYNFVLATLNKETGRLVIQTTKVGDLGVRQRLNSLNNVNVMKSNNRFYLNGLEWNGEKVEPLLGFKYIN